MRREGPSMRKAVEGLLEVGSMSEFFGGVHSMYVDDGRCFGCR
jgi:hypothetical protein